MLESYSSYKTIMNNRTAVALESYSSRKTVVLESYSNYKTIMNNRIVVAPESYSSRKTVVLESYSSYKTIVSNQTAVVGQLSAQLCYSRKTVIKQSKFNRTVQCFSSSSILILA